MALFPLEGPRMRMRVRVGTEARETERGLDKAREWGGKSPGHDAINGNKSDRGGRVGRGGRP